MGSFWCGDFFEKLKKSQITPKVNKLNVDDKTLVCCVVLSPVPLGARFRNDRIEIVEKEIENDRTIPGDLRTAKIL